VVQNFLNLLAKVRLDPKLTSGVVVSRQTDDDFDIPTTVAERGNVLYLVNARFTTPPTPETEYWMRPDRQALGASATRRKGSLSITSTALFERRRQGSSPWRPAWVPSGVLWSGAFVSWL
jgi:hypothetical protein